MFINEYICRARSLIILLVVMASACSQVDKPSNKIISKVGNRILTIDDIRSNLSSADLETDSAGAVNQYIDQWERRQVLRLEAERLDLHQNPDVQTEIEQFTDVLLSDAMSRYLYSLLDTVVLTTTEVDEFLEMNPAATRISEPVIVAFQFTGSDLDSMRVLHSKMGNKTEARSHIEQLKRDDPAWWQKQYIPRLISYQIIDFPSLRLYWNSSDPFEASPVVEKGNEFHFFVIGERYTAGSVIDTSMVRPYIADWLLLQKKNRRLRSLEQSILLNAQQSDLVQRFD